jgi:phage-related protein
MELPQIIKEHHKLINVMIDMNHLLRGKNRVRLSGENEISYAVQFCTIRCNIFRGIGKSKYMIDNATKDDLIVVKDESIKKLFNSRLDGKKIDIISAEKIKSMQAHAGKNYVNIYIDEPGMCFNSRDLFEFYVKFVNPQSRNQTFILLGM